MNFYEKSNIQVSNERTCTSYVMQYYVQLTLHRACCSNSLNESSIKKNKKKKNRERERKITRRYKRLTTKFWVTYDGLSVLPVALTRFKPEFVGRIGRHQPVNYNITFHLRRTRILSNTPLVISSFLRFLRSR